MTRLRANASSSSPKWPGTNYPLKRDYTGLKIIDKLITILNPFVASILDGSDPSLSLWSFFIIGQYGTSFALSSLESYRYGNKGEVITL